MIRKQTHHTELFLFEKLNIYNNLKHFISTNILKSEGNISNNLDISFSGGLSNEQVIRNRKILAEAADIPFNSFVMQEQIHGSKVKLVKLKEKGCGIYNKSEALKESDSMITNEKGICLFLFAADCVPILFYDPVCNSIGAAHAGWKGTVKKIALKTVEKMQSEFKSKAENIIACLGPSISVDSYEIGENVYNEVLYSLGTTEGFLIFNPQSKKYHMDLWYSNVKILKDAGLKEENIQVSGINTYHNTDLFFSARKKNTGRFAAGIMLL